MLMKILGIVLMIIGGIWVLSRLLNIPKMISIISDVKEREGLSKALWRVFSSEIILGYGPGFLIIYIGIHLL